MSKITISVPDPMARAFEAASPEQRRKLELLLQLRLEDLVLRPIRPLQEILDEVGTQATEAGLTDAELELMLRHE